MQAKVIRFVLAAGASTALGWSPSALAASLSVSLEASAVTVSGLAPGGRAAVLGISRLGVEAIVRVERQDAILQDMDGDGSVSWELPASEGRPPGPAPRSVWLAVDLANGEWAVASPASYPTGDLPLGSGVGLAAWGFIQPGGFLELLWVRPGEEVSAGVWAGAVGDGGASDADGDQNGSLRVTPGAFVAVESSAPPPPALAAGDVLIAVRPGTLAHGVATVGGEGATR